MSRPDEPGTAPLHAADDTAAGDGAADTAGAPAAPSRLAAWTGLARRNRALWVTAAVAVVALVAGLVLGRFVLTPDDAAAQTPEPGLVTAPVELGQLSNDVTIRGEVGYADPVEVTVDTSALSGPAVVTGQVPEVGAELGPLSVALELAGRPVVVLPGELPAYRTLRFGVSGPDVVQFKEAMRAVGLDAGDPASNVFDRTAADAVSALYAQAGYPAPAGEEGAADGVAAAQEAVRSAQQGLTAAQAELSAKRAGPTAVDVRTADNAVASAQRALDAALATTPDDAVTVGDLRDALALAQLQRQQLNAAPSTTAEQAAVTSAQNAVSDAQDALAVAQQDALPALPAGEILYLTQLPRRVDATELKRGAVLEGTAMTVSGATLGLSGTVAPADARLLTPGMTAAFDLPDGGESTATITAVTPGDDAEARSTVELTPADLTPEQVTALQGTNVRVSIPVGATEGDVLSVPLAALTAGPGGESRVEVVDGDPRDGDRAATRLVTVETGLAADGAVEIRPTDGDLGEGDLVVVGR